MPTFKVDLIAAARPNFMKVAPLFHALARESWCEPRLVHTGQHYDANMSDAFFADLRLPEPHFHLGVGSGTHAQQTGGVMVAYEQLCLDQRPDWIVVVGDVNSTAAAAMVAAKLHIPFAHLEAGLRSRDRRMPEEINRLVTDALADLLWTPSPDADDNLRAEGVADERIERVGNVMIDSYELLRERIESERAAERLNLRKRGYATLTLHRPSNVDERESLSGLAESFRRIGKELPLVFPVHPRTRKSLETFGLLERLNGSPGVHLLEPLGYVEFMSLVSDARLAITDSGGLQEETTYLGIPCLTLRENTERPITVTEGTNQLVAPDELEGAVSRILNGEGKAGRRPDLWDGKAAARCVASLRRRLPQHGS